MVASTACARARERDVARGDHGHIDERDELGGEGVVGEARVHLLGRARVQGQRGGARLDQARADGEAVARPVRGAAAHLHRDRQRRRGRDRLDDPRRVGRVVEQRGAGAGLGHLADGAAEVDVHDVGAGRLDDPCGLGHRGGVGAEDLDRERVLVGGDAQVAERAFVLVLDPRDRDHLRADEPGAVAAALAAKCLHAHTGHGREHEPARDLDPAEIPVRVQVDL